MASLSTRQSGQHGPPLSGQNQGTNGQFSGERACNVGAAATGVRMQANYLTLSSSLMADESYGYLFS